MSRPEAMGDGAGTATIKRKAADMYTVSGYGRRQVLCLSASVPELSSEGRNGQSLCALDVRNCSGCWERGCSS